jgi:hypothetical protein
VAKGIKADKAIKAIKAGEVAEKQKGGQGRPSSSVIAIAKGALRCGAVA